MAKEISREFRPQHRDIEVRYLDDFGVQKFLYVGLSGPVVVDVEAIIHKHLSQEGRLAENVRLALNPTVEPQSPPEAPPVASPRPPEAAEAVKPPEPIRAKSEAPVARKGKKGKK